MPAAATPQRHNDAPPYQNRQQKQLKGMYPSSTHANEPYDPIIKADCCHDGQMCVTFGPNGRDGPASLRVCYIYAFGGTSKVGTDEMFPRAVIQA